MPQIEGQEADARRIYFRLAPCSTRCSPERKHSKAKRRPASLPRSSSATRLRHLQSSLLHHRRWIVWSEHAWLKTLKTGGRERAGLNEEPAMDCGERSRGRAEGSPQEKQSDCVVRSSPLFHRCGAGGWQPWPTFIGCPKPRHRCSDLRSLSQTVNASVMAPYRGCTYGP